MTGQWFSPGTPVSFTNKTDCHDIAKIVLKVALNTINQPTKPNTREWRIKAQNPRETTYKFESGRASINV